MRKIELITCGVDQLEAAKAAGLTPAQAKELAGILTTAAERTQP
ncbi:hypothetical protein FRC0474_00617 [Corynebacterium diphtheriae]|nr:hypothetical protein FRC0474_00617 [Corynebacterium diphtheriae]